MTYKVFNPQNITVFCGAFVFSPYKSRTFKDSSLSAEQINLFTLANRDQILMVQYINDAPTFVNSVFGRIGNAIAQTGDYSWAQITGKPTTLEGYGITDGVTPEEVTQLAISLSEMAVPDGVATLDSTGKLTADQLPTGVTTGGVISVASLTGVVTRVQLLTALQLDQVNNTSDANKPLSQAEQTALGLKVDSSALGSAAFVSSTVFATAAQGALAVTAVQPSSLATVAFTGSYSDLSGKPVFATIATTGEYSDLVGAPTLSAVALSGSYLDLTNRPALSTVAISGNYSDLNGRPTLAVVATSGNYSDLTGKPVLSTVATTGAYSDLTSKPTLSTVASTGSYTDLLNKPTLYSNPMTTAGDLVVGSTGGAASRLAIGANGSALMVSSGTVGWTLLATVATTGSYNSLSNLPALGGAAFLNVGTTAGTVAAGNDSRIVGALQIANALSDLVSYTVATLPTASSNTRHFAYVTDLYGGAEFAYCDGTNWRRLSDRSVVN